MPEKINHLKFFEEAYREALIALSMDEVPVGAVVVLDGQIIGRGHNRRITNCDGTAHAEIEAIRDACMNTGSWRLDGASIYVTNEPCLMCAGAIMHSRIQRVYFSSLNAKMGAVMSNYRVFDEKTTPYRVEYHYIPDEKTEKLLKNYFSSKRGRSIDEKGSSDSVYYGCDCR
ncbi:nucleoside deaminase [Persephonella sp.]